MQAAENGLMAGHCMMRNGTPTGLENLFVLVSSVKSEEAL